MPYNYEQAMKTFDPNTTTNYPFATYCPGRSSAGFKVHRNRAHALNSIKSNSHNAILYKFVDGKWVEIFRVENGQMDVCVHGGPGPNDYKYNTRWTDLKTDHPRLLRVCNRCHYA